MHNSYIELLNDIEKNGEYISSSSNTSLNRSFQTKELNNVQLKIDDFKQLLLNDDEVSYYEKELDWYLDVCTVDLKKLAKDVLGAVNRCGPNSNYGEMMLHFKNQFGITQKQWVVEKLKKDRNSRQAIAFYNKPAYQYFDNEDFVCCLSQMFNIKGNMLNTVVNSRSNDLINSFRFDSIWWRIFQNIVLSELKETYPELELGYLLVNIFSAHYYLKDSDKIEKIRDCDKNNTFKSLTKYL